MIKLSEIRVRYELSRTKSDSKKKAYATLSLFQSATVGDGIAVRCRINTLLRKPRDAYKRFCTYEL